MATEMEQIVEQMQAMMLQNNTFAEQLATVQAQNMALSGQAQQHATDMANMQAAAAAGGGGGGDRGSSFVQKWAPDSWNGELNTWKDWQIKFRSYMGSLLRGGDRPLAGSRRRAQADERESDGPGGALARCCLYAPRSIACHLPGQGTCGGPEERQW